MVDGSNAAEGDLWRNQVHLILVDSRDSYLTTCEMFAVAKMHEMLDELDEY